MEKQLQVDQLHYELNACKRRSETEVLSLRQRISDLELQVTEARKEADEYYRANTESNMEVTALANQVTTSSSSHCDPYLSAFCAIEFTL